MVDPAARAFGDRVRRERGRRGWKHRKDFAAALQYRVRIVASLENGDRSNFSEEFKGAVERELGWEDGDFDRVRAGGEPNRRYPPELVRLIDMWPTLDPGVRTMLLDLAERSRGS